MKNNRVLESAQFISAHSKHVNIPRDGILKAADLMLDRMKSVNYSVANWKKHPLHPKVSNESAIDWIFLVDLLNFSFFSTKPPGHEYAVTYKGCRYTGYWTLCACINRALDEGIPVTSPSFYSTASDDTLKSIFRADPLSDEDIPMLETRLSLLRSHGRTLVDLFGGSFVNCVLKSRRSAQNLLDTIVANFDSFKDEHEFQGQTVYIYKRAQILIADIWGCFEGEGLGQFDDFDTITMFADYRVPQSIVAFGAMQYSEDLLKTIHDPHHMLESGDPREVEIRGNSIWAVELIRRRIQELSGESYHAAQLDFFLWDYAKENKKLLSGIPIHHTRSVFY